MKLPVRCILNPDISYDALCVFSGQIFTNRKTMLAMRLCLFSKRFLLGFGIAMICLTGTAGARELITIAGATFPAPLYRKWIQVYPGSGHVRIDYQAVGSGKGIQLLTEHKVDIGASDIFLSDEEMSRQKQKILHIPTCIGAVAVIYNLPSEKSLRLNSDLLRRIFTGTISNWSDIAIRRINPSLKPADLPITPVHRTDSSGTTYIFTEYLSKTSTAWAMNLGKGKAIRWPVGVGVTGNDGMAEMVSRIPGSIGYVSLSYAEAKQLSVARIRNRSGNFVYPTQDSVSQAADIRLPPDNRMMITDTASPHGYPLSSFTYMLIFQEQPRNTNLHEKVHHLFHFLSWIIHDGQQYTKPLFYAPLTPTAVANIEKTLQSITYTGVPFE